MATIEVRDEFLGEIKELAKDFFEADQADCSEVNNRRIAGDLETIGYRIIEALYPEEYRKHFFDLMDAVGEEGRLSMDKSPFDFFKLHADLREVLYQVSLMENKPDDPNVRKYAIGQIREVLEGTFKRVNTQIEKKRG